MNATEARGRITEIEADWLSIPECRIINEPLDTTVTPPYQQKFGHNRECYRILWPKYYFVRSK